jgi:hypothetical protein
VCLYIVSFSQFFSSQGKKVAYQHAVWVSLCVRMHVFTCIHETLHQCYDAGEQLNFVLFNFWQSITLFCHGGYLSFSSQFMKNVHICEQKRVKLWQGKGKVKFTLEQAMKAQRGSRGIALLINLSARWGWVVNAMPQLLYPWERSSTHCIRGWVGPRTSLDKCGKSRLHWDSIPGPSSP